MLVKWSEDQFEYFIEQKIDGQTFYMAFQEEDYTSDTIYFNVQMNHSSKRKTRLKDIDAIKITGKGNPIKALQNAILAFKKLEAACLQGFNENYNVVIYIRWSDNRRRDIYAKFLSRYGYYFGKDRDNEKCLFRKYKKGSYINGGI